MNLAFTKTRSTIGIQAKTRLSRSSPLERTSPFHDRRIS